MIAEGFFIAILLPLKFKVRLKTLLEMIERKPYPCYNMD